MPMHPSCSWYKRRSVLLQLLMVMGVGVGALLFGNLETSPERLYAAYSHTQAGFTDSYDLSLTPGDRDHRLGYSAWSGNPGWRESGLPTFGLGKPGSDGLVGQILDRVFPTRTGETHYRATGETVLIRGDTWFVLQKDDVE